MAAPGRRGKERGGVGAAGQQPMTSRDAGARAGLQSSSQLAEKEGGTSQPEAAVVIDEPIADWAVGARANEGAGREQKGLSKAPAPFPRTISHDATVGGRGLRTVAAAAIL